MKNGGLLNRIFNVDRGNEENEDDTSSREVFYWIVQGGRESIPLFPFFSFRENFLTIFEKTGKERERELLSSNLFVDASKWRKEDELGELGWIFAA